MKRKFWLKTISLTLTSAGLVSLVSCSNTNSNTKNSDDYKKLQLEYKKYREQNENNSRAKDNEITRLKNELSESVTEKDSKNNELIELSGKIDELTRKIQVMSGTAIERNGLSVRNLYNQISNFIVSDFTTALKEQKPETYSKEKSLLDQIVASIISTNADVATTEEDFANLWTWESTVFHLLSRSKLIYEYIDDTINPITVYTPKSEEMDLLFQWRIRDLNKIISIVNSKPQGTYENKQDLLDRLQSYVEKYQQAIDESSLLQHQISFWYNLEQDGGDGVANKFIDFSSPNMRSLLPSLKIDDSEFRVSLFPVYKQIIDPKFISEAKAKVLELQGIYKQWIDSNVRTYINSVRYDKLYNSVKSIIDRINVLLLPNNLTYFNEFNVWEDLNKFVNDAKAVLLDGYLVDNTKEKQDYDAEVNQEFDSNNNNSFAKIFEDEFKPLSQKSDNESKYLYKNFYDKYSQSIKNIKGMDTSTFQKSFLRYTKYQIVKKEIEISKKIIKFYTLTGDNLEDPKLLELLKLDNSAKYDKLIRESTKNKERDQESFKKQKELLEAFLLNFDSDNETAKESILNAYEKMIPIIDEFVEKLNPNIDENNNIIGEWGHMYGDKTNKVINLLNQLKNTLETSKDLANNKEDDDDQELKDNMNKIVLESNNFMKMFIGKTSDSEESNTNKSLIQEFNEWLQTEYYELEGDDYDSQTKIFVNIIKILNDIKVLKNTSLDKAEVIKLLNNKKELSNIYLSELEEIFSSGKAWSEFSESELEKVRTPLKNILNLFNTKIDSSIDKLNKSNNITNELDEIIEFAISEINHIGSTSDGVPPISKILEETLESYDNDIKRYESKREKSLPLSKILASQEIIVLLRYWKNNNKSEYEKIQLHVDPQGTETYHDRDLANFLNKELTSVSNKQNYNSIMNVDGTLNSFDIEVKEGDSKENSQNVNNEFFESVTEITPKVIYDKFNEIESEYAKSLYDFLFKNNESSEELKTRLVEKRMQYYTFLNKLSEMDVFLSNSFIRFGSDLLTYIEDDPEQNFLLSDLLSYYAKTAAVGEIMTEIHEKYIK
ncbi:hypothetical protein [Mycoplasma sp. CSL10166]|uniref:hypothetical protein n=1 Tax=Mycoplasma sp. CSL10166 TaxID=2813825 RepID=UPI00197C4611|nr:hypothetical protein [Mycoplasma sp. CSL10166]MBN4084347.1 hypothetical protein [Mycoplasma sp. CSL10166]